MSQHPTNAAAAAKPNHALEPFSVLIGNWNTTGTHGQMPDTILHGHASAEWLENGAFLIMRSKVDDPRFPATITIFGSDDAEGEFYMLTFDERGISRKYNTTLSDNTWRWWRDAEGFRQRYQGIIKDGGNTIVTGGELSEDDSPWKEDLNLTYTRIE